MTWKEIKETFEVSYHPNDNTKRILYRKDVPGRTLRIEYAGTVTRVNNSFYYDELNVKVKNVDELIVACNKWKKSLLPMSPEGFNPIMVKSASDFIKFSELMESIGAEYDSNKRAFIFETNAWNKTHKTAVVVGDERHNRESEKLNLQIVVNTDGSTSPYKWETINISNTDVTKSFEQIQSILKCMVLSNISKNFLILNNMSEHEVNLENLQLTETEIVNLTINKTNKPLKEVMIEQLERTLNQLKGI